MMTKLILERFGHTHDIAVCFANTGQEHPATLDFIRDCDEYFKFGTVWLEAVFTHGERVGVRHRIVDYHTASRNGEPFEELVRKHGIPNAASPICTGRLKINAMESWWHRELGWEKGSFDTAIGIRADEVDRVSVHAKKHRFIYPLVTWGYTKDRVKDECEKWPFDLRIPGDHYGNCVWCWKKSLRKLMTIAKHTPNWFEFPMRMEREYSEHRVTPATASPDGTRKFFRKHLSSWDIIEMAHFGPEFEEFQDHRQLARLTDLDIGSACGDSCEVGTEETDSFREDPLL